MARKPVHDWRRIGETLLAELSQGKLVKDVCKKLGIAPTLVSQRAASDPGFAKVYVRAREAQAHALAEDALKIADEKCDTSEGVQRNRLRVDTRKWMASKLASTIYGDRSHVDVNVNVAIAERMKRARERAGR